MSSFVLQSKKFLPTLGITLETYEHTPTGAKHYHFSSDHTENVFMVALRTMPEDSTGVAHILEHTALCGSEHFPVRDPFFSMLRRSLQTFMNAFTSSDWTAYPFATENREDFDHLLRIYLDAVFFPKLDRLDFLQEGHRLEFDEQGKLVTKGVVYNEMKGVYGNPLERIFELQKSLLQPETTYHYDSWGAPEHILALKYEDFLAFHAKHYHPTNATFFTFGNISADEHHARFEALALNRFQSRGELVFSRDEARYTAPIRAEHSYPSTDTVNPHQTHILVSWLLGATYCAEDRLEAELVSKILMDHSASPLRQALEKAAWSAAPSPLSFLDDSAREMRFSAGIITDTGEHANQTEALIFETLETLAMNGVDPSEALAVIDQIEIALREQNTGYPYGLSLFLTAIPAATHGGDIALLLDPSEILDALREKVQDRSYISGLIRRFFLDNPHRLTLVMSPDFQGGKTEEEAERSYHERIAQSLWAEEKEQIQRDMVALKERQSVQGDMDCLPRLSPDHIPLEVRTLRADRMDSGRLSSYQWPTNRLAYRDLLFPVMPSTVEEYADMAVVWGLVAELGAGGHTYEDIQKMIARETGGISAWLQNGAIYGTDMNRSFFRVNMRCLAGRIDRASDLLRMIAGETTFTEVAHIRDILSERLLSMKSVFTNNGHQIAMLRASSGNTLQATLSEMTGGIESMYHLRRFLERSDTDIATRSTELYTQARTSLPIECHIGNNHSNSPLWEGVGVMQTGNLEIPHTPKQIKEAWITDVAVSYCALSIPVVRSDHRDAAPLMILAQFLRDGFLHSAIRERWGAYGAGARYHAQAETFDFFSYRDPRMQGTFADFEHSLTWLLEAEHNPLRLEEAKLGVFAQMDRPAALSAEARSDYERSLYGYTDAARNIQRAALLAVTLDDLKAVVEKYFYDLSRASRVVITSESERQNAMDLGLEVRELV